MIATKHIVYAQISCDTISCSASSEYIVIGLHTNLGDHFRKLGWIDINEGHSNTRKSYHLCKNCASKLQSSGLVKDYKKGDVGQ